MVTDGGGGGGGDGGGCGGGDVVTDGEGRSEHNIGIRLLGTSSSSQIRVYN